VLFSRRCVPKACPASPAGVVARRRKSSWMQPSARRTVIMFNYTLTLKVAINVAKVGQEPGKIG
jgi:hypothetical protein